MAMAMMASSLIPSSSSSSSRFCASSITGQRLSLSSIPSASSSSSSRSPTPLLIEASKKIKGKVTCASNDKTVAVEVVRLFIHPKYKKRIKSSKKYHAHDEENACKVGDSVILTPCRPISKTKTFLVSEIVSKGRASEEELPPLESLASSVA